MSTRRPRLDDKTKEEIKESLLNGRSCEEIASKLGIHVEYIRRIAKSANLNENEGQTSNRRGIKSTPVSKKRKVEEISEIEDDSIELVKQSTLRTSRSKSGRISPLKRSPRVSFSNDVEMVEDSSDSVNGDLDASFEAIAMKNHVQSTLRKSPLKSHLSIPKSTPVVTDVGVSPVLQQTRDQGSAARVSTSSALLSPCFKTYSLDTCTQTDAIVFYDQEYIDFLHQTHQEEMDAKEVELAELKAKLAATRQELERTKAELIKEKERIGFEKGWKKYF